MSEFKVAVEATDINRAIAEAITKSVLGQTVADMVRREVERLTSTWDSPVKRIVEQEVREVVRATVLGSKAVIEERVRQQITDAVMDDIVKKAIERLTRE